MLALVSIEVAVILEPKLLLLTHNKCLSGSQLPTTEWKINNVVVVHDYNAFVRFSVGKEDKFK